MDTKDAKIIELMADFPVVVEQNVIWGDMDAYRHVNNVVYFRYFENARLEYVRRLDWFAFEKATGIGPILASTQARFRRAITYPDTILTGARLLTLEADRFHLEHKIVSRAQGEVVTEGQGTIVTYHYADAKKVPVPEELKQRILALEKNYRS
jgi:acyl-CoA thioester hydrolase